MSWLADFFAGVSRTAPGVIDSIEQREKEERKRQEVEAERKRLEAEADRRYQRGLDDQRAATLDTRAYNESLAEAARKRAEEERLRVEADREAAVVGAIAARNQVSPDDVNRVRKGGLLSQGGAARDFQEGSPDQAKKILTEFHAVISGTKLGSTPAQTFKTLDDEARKARWATLTPAQQEAENRQDRLMNGGDVTTAEARIKLLEEQAEALSKRPPAASNQGESRLIRTYDARAQRASDDLRAAEGTYARVQSELAKEGLSNPNAQARAAAALKPYADLIEQRKKALLQAEQDVIHVSETGKRPPRELMAKADLDEGAKPAIPPAAVEQLRKDLLAARTDQQRAEQKRLFAQSAGLPDVAAVDALLGPAVDPKPEPPKPEPPKPEPQKAENALSRIEDSNKNKILELHADVVKATDMLRAASRSNDPVALNRYAQELQRVTDIRNAAAEKLLGNGAKTFLASLR